MASRVPIVREDHGISVGHQGIAAGVCGLLQRRALGIQPVLLRLPLRADPRNAIEHFEVVLTQPLPPKRQPVRR